MNNFKIGDIVTNEAILKKESRMFKLEKMWCCKVCGSINYYYPTKKQFTALKLSSYNIRCRDCDGITE